MSFPYRYFHEGFSVLLTPQTLEDKAILTLQRRIQVYIYCFNHPPELKLTLPSSFSLSFLSQKPQPFIYTCKLRGLVHQPTSIVHVSFLNNKELGSNNRAKGLVTKMVFTSGTNYMFYGFPKPPSGSVMC